MNTFNKTFTELRATGPEQTHMYCSRINPTKYHQELVEKIQVINQCLEYMSKTDGVIKEFLPLEDFSFVAKTFWN